MLVLEIDYREQKILKLIDPLINIVVTDTIYGPIKYNNIEFYYKISNLIVGDFILKNDNINDDSIYYIIERKSIQDLASSIIDGRFREQKERLSETNNEIIYVIEGKLKKTVSISNTTLKSSIINLQVKHNYKVFRTECESDSLEYMLILYKKISESNDFKKVTPTTIKKKSNSLSIYLNQLMMLHGVSKNTAVKISELYPTLFSLIDAYRNKTIQECECLLCDISLNSTRKVTKALSKKIYHQLHDKETETMIVDLSSEISTDVSNVDSCLI